MSDVKASFQLLHLARAATGRIGLPARRIGLSHQLVHRFCLAVEYRTGLLAAQHDELERVPKQPVELAAAVTKADWRQTRELRPARILSLRSYRRPFSTQLEFGSREDGSSNEAMLITCPGNRQEYRAE